MFAAIFFYFVLPAIVLFGIFFVPKWLFWITPHAYSPYDVLAGQYGRKAALWIIAITVVVIGGIFFVLHYGSYHGW